MIDDFLIFQTDGTVVFSQKADPDAISTINTLISDVLLTSKQGLGNICIGNKKLIWTNNNKYSLYFVVIYSKFISILNAENFVAKVAEEFVTKHETDLTLYQSDPGVAKWLLDGFRDTFNDLLLALTSGNLFNQNEIKKKFDNEVTKSPQKKQRNWNGVDNADSSFSVEIADTDTGKKKYEKKEKNVPKKAKSSNQTLLSLLNLNFVADSENIKEPMAKFKQGLIQKNVASDVADVLVSSLTASLIGKKIKLKSVKENFKKDVEKILFASNRGGILSDIQSKKDKPYSIVFVGINGVGKSTTLSKVAAKLTQNNLKVSIAACDTFRSGAVEQLQKHCNALDLPLYSGKYGDDPAKVAKSAISKAKADNRDVILIDTAGRMQNNESLMKQLANLVVMNSVDLILFVGEAITGNDSVNQVTEFNNSLIDYSSVKIPRAIDGLCVTKYDTIDDKPGTVLSLVHAIGKPIFFVGVGQTYQDLLFVDRDFIDDVVQRLLE